MGLPLFGTVIDYSVASNNSEIVLALGTVTFVNLTSSSDFLNVIGIQNTGGNVDGFLVCFVNKGPFGIVFLHNSSLESTVGNRLLNFSLASKLIASATSAAWRYDGGTNRWHHLWSSF